MKWIRFLTQLLYIIISVFTLCVILLLTFLYTPALQHKLADAIVEQTFHNEIPPEITGDVFGGGLKISKIQSHFKNMQINANDVNIVVSWTPKRLHPLIKLQLDELSIQPYAQLDQKISLSKNKSPKVIIPMLITDIDIQHLTIKEPWSGRHLDAYDIHIDNKKSLTSIDGLFYGQKFHFAIDWFKNHTPKKVTFKNKNQNFVLNGSWHNKVYTLKDKNGLFLYTLTDNQTWTLTAQIAIPSFLNNKKNQLKTDIHLIGQGLEIQPKSRFFINGMWDNHPLKLFFKSPFPENKILLSYGKNHIIIDKKKDAIEADINLHEIHLINPNLAGNIVGKVSKNKKWQATFNAKKFIGYGLELKDTNIVLEGKGKNIHNANIYMGHLNWHNQKLKKINLIKKHHDVLQANWINTHTGSKSQFEASLTNDKITVRKSPHLFWGWHLDRDVEINYVQNQWESNYFCLKKSDDKTCLRLNFNPKTHAWQAHYNVNIKQLSLDTTTLFAQLTTAKIDLAEISGKGNFHGKKFKYTGGKGNMKIKKIDGYIINIIPSFFMPIDYYFQNGTLAMSLEKNHIDLKTNAMSKQGNLSINGTYTDALKLHLIAPHLLIKQNDKSYLQGNIDLILDINQKSKLRGDITVASGYLKPKSLTGVEYLPDDIIIQTESYTDNPLHTDINLDIKPNVTAEYIGLYGKLSGKLRIVESPEDGTQVNGRITLNDAFFGVFGRSIKLKTAHITYYNTNWQNPILEFSAQKPITDNTITTAHLRVFGSPNQLYTEIYSIPRGLSDLELITHLFAKTDLSVYKKNDPTLTNLLSGSQGQRAMVNFLSAISQIESKLPIDYITFNTTRVDTSGEQVIPTSVTLGTKLAQKLLLKVRLHVNQSEEDSVTLAYNIRPNLAVELSSTAEGKGLFFIWNGFWE